MNDIQVFQNEQFGSVRVVDRDGEPYFAGRDVAEVLGYSNPRKALADHVEDEDKTDGVTIRDSIGREQNPTFINESGLYSLILRSQLPKAKQFKRWITHEVIPSIRKTGGYIAGQGTLSDDELMAKALMVAQRQIEQKNAQIAQMKPKEIFADAVSASESTILIGDLAKILKGNGVDIGQKRLFQWLRDNDYLIKSGASINSPTQKAMELGLFKIKENAVVMPDGATKVTKTTKVTGKGQTYFINKFLNEKNE